MKKLVSVEATSCIYAKMDNRPGALEALARVFNERRTNIDAFSAETVGSTGFIRILCARPRETAEALRSRGIEAYESEILVVSLPNKPGQLFNVFGDLAAAGLNVEAVMTTVDGKVGVRTSDNERAAQVLRKL